MRRIQKWLLVCGAVLIFGGVCHVQHRAIASIISAPSFTIGGVNPEERPFAGTVYDPSGVPAPGVVVLASVSVLGSFDTKSDANGKYAFNWRPMLATGTATAPPLYALVARDLEHNLAAMHTIDETTTNLDLQLQPGLAISTTLQDTAGKPVTNAAIIVMLYLGASEPVAITPAFTADDQGRVQIPALPQGGRYVLYFRAPGYGSARQITILEDESRTSRLVLPAVQFKAPNLTLSGHVLEADGRPAIGARVTFSGEGQPSTNTATDATGHFTVNVCEGPVTVIVIGQRATGSAKATGGDTNVVVRLASGNRIANGASSTQVAVGGGLETIKGTVFDPSGAPAAGVAITGLGPGASPNQDLRSDAAGKFSYSWQPPIEEGSMKPIHYIPLLMARDLEHNFAATTNMDETTTNLDLHLQPGLVLSGSVLEHTGAAAMAATVRLIMTHRVMNSTMTTSINTQPAIVDEKGTFTFSGLPQGEGYTVNVTAPGFGNNTVTVQEMQTRAAGLKLPAITLKPADRPLEGVVLGPDGRAAPWATVSVSGQGQPSTGTQADGNGHFALKVCEGVVLVRAYWDGAALNFQRATGSVQTLGGDKNVILRLAAPAVGGGAAPGAIPTVQTNYPAPIGPLL
jgi:hypothetical protein